MAVYTDIGDDELVAFIAQYDIGTVVSCKGIAEGVENSNFLLRTERGEYILTIYEKRVKRDDLPFFLGLLDHLAGRGIDCPTPIHGHDGSALRTLAGKPAAIVQFLEGVWIRRPKPEHCQRLGGAIARLHLAGKDFPLRRTNDLSLAGWKALATNCGGADDVQLGLAAALARELGHLEMHWPRELPAGIIHADLFPDNVFFLGDRLSGLIDFYFACNDFFAYDLAIAMNAWCFEPDGAFNITKARLLLSAYGAVRPLTAAELEALPLLARGAAVRFLLTRLYDWLHQVQGALVRPKQPLEYWHKLRFHQGVQSIAAYGLA
ncbi:MAG: homoserine kinase [Alphaproteobacteria bacterium]|nr:homoserine kinase [Alphaproteobacteria bacterium]